MGPEICHCSNYGLFYSAILKNRVLHVPHTLLISSLCRYDSYITSCQVLEGHSRGIQTLAWCGSDGGMLLTSSRDDHMICWNPNNTAVPGGEVRITFVIIISYLC